MQCEEWGTEARVIALRRGEDITVEEALALVLEVVTAGGRGPVLQAYWFAIFGWIAGRMTFEAHLGSLDASKTFISQETFIQGKLASPVFFLYHIISHIIINDDIHSQKVYVCKIYSGVEIQFLIIVLEIQVYAIYELNQ